jgi:hemoglobin
MAGQSMFEVLGGEEGLRRLVDAFYDRMEADSAYRGIRELHPASLAGSRGKLFWFLCGWTGGPDHFVSRFGHPRLRARHLPFAIGESERDQWLACMAGAMSDTGLDPAVQDHLLTALQPTADWMRNVAPA